MDNQIDTINNQKDASIELKLRNAEIEKEMRAIKYKYGKLKSAYTKKCGLSLDTVSVTLSNEDKSAIDKFTQSVILEEYKSVDFDDKSINLYCDKLPMYQENGNLENDVLGDQNDTKDI